MDYAATLKYLDAVQDRGIKLGLRTMRALLALLDHPQHAFPSIAVAGTNGKGSVCAFLASILREADFRTGLYTSPHLVRYEERIMIGGILISPDEFAAGITRVRDVIDTALAEGSLPSHPTHFEVITAAALDHFRRGRVDVAVLEVGLGGRLDAVAAADSGLAVITNVGMDHMQYLGESVEAIAVEKAGIIGPACRLVVTGETAGIPLARIREAASARGARLVEVGDRPAGDLPPLRMAGDHQRRNAALAAEAATRLSEAGVPAAPIEPSCLRRGLAAAWWPGRLQIVSHEPLVVLDGAHNADGCDALARWMEGMGAARRARLCLVFGVLDDKQADAMMRSIVPLAARIVLTRGASPRFRDPEALKAAASRLAPDRVTVVSGTRRALDDARAWAGSAGAVVVCGSLYLVGEAFEALGMDPYGTAIPGSGPSSER
jgi:dihydrofolate synthase/folylpolyglutamate synthase